MRKAKIERVTGETKVLVELEVDGEGRSEIHTGVGFLDHMLTLFAKHGFIDLKVEAQGDLAVDCHHTVEDIGICLGQAFSEALGDKAGIRRYGSCVLPMDETLVLVACDLSGRDYLGWAVNLPSPKVGTFDTELAKEFFLAFVRACPCSLHFRQLSGENTHHILEAIFKGAGRTLKMAAAPDCAHVGEIPSTKGTL